MIHRSREWLIAVRSLGACVLCGKGDVQAAHRNEGKGLAVKADDAATACLCTGCHREIDQGANLSRESRRAMMDRAIVLTVIELARRGLIGPLQAAGTSGSPARRGRAQRRSKGNTTTSSKIIPHSGRPL